MMLYPIMKNNAILHSESVAFKGEKVSPFPVKRKEGEFIGECFFRYESEKGIRERTLGTLKNANGLKHYRLPRSTFIGWLISKRFY